MDFIYLYQYEYWLDDLEEKKKKLSACHLPLPLMMKIRLYYLLFFSETIFSIDYVKLNAKQWIDDP